MGFLDKLFNRKSKQAEANTPVKPAASAKPAVPEKAPAPVKPAQPVKPAAPAKPAKAANSGTYKLDPEKTLDKIAVMNSNPRIEYYFEIKDSIQDWPWQKMSLLYRLIGKACDAGNADPAYSGSTVALSFFAASLALDSRFERDCWIKFDIIYGFQASAETAKKLHEYYPLPETLEEARNYKIEPLYNK